MKIRGRTCLVALWLMILCLPAAASPGAGQGACLVRLQLSAEAAFEDPMARWLNQLCDMVAIQAQAARWDQGALTQITLTMGQHQAFTLKVVGLDGQVRFSSSLTQGTVGLSPLCQWGQALLEAGEQVVDLPGGGRLIPLSGEGVGRALSVAAVSMRAWAALARAQACVDCENCGQCETCQQCLFAEGIAALADALGDRFDEEAFDQNVLLIDIEPVEAQNLLPVSAAEAPEAPDELNVQLVRRAVKKTVEAIAANQAGDGETDQPLSPLA